MQGGGKISPGKGKGRRRGKGRKKSRRKAQGRYERRFAELRKAGRAAFIPFAVIGDPDYRTSLEAVRAMCRHADCLELGLAFSDPIADGKTIQKADVRALKNGINTDSAFGFVKRMRREFPELPIGLLVYYNLIYRRGIGKFYRDAKKAGVDGILAADVPVEESAALLETAEKSGIRQIFLVTQTTDAQRMRKIVGKAGGFVYVVSLLGVTGARERLQGAALSLIRRARKAVQETGAGKAGKAGDSGKAGSGGREGIPLCVGFGISKAIHARAVVRAGADGVIVGSAIVGIIEKNLRNRRKMLSGIEKFCRAMGRAMAKAG